LETFSTEKNEFVSKQTRDGELEAARWSERSFFSVFFLLAWLLLLLLLLLAKQLGTTRTFSNFENSVPETAVFISLRWE
jgi:hypothetical protein